MYTVKSTQSTIKERTVIIEVSELGFSVRLEKSVVGLRGMKSMLLQELTAIL